jgi:hypothetical protein
LDEFADGAAGHTQDVGQGFGKIRSRILGGPAHGFREGEFTKIERQAHHGYWWRDAVLGAGLSQLLRERHDYSFDKEQIAGIHHAVGQADRGEFAGNASITESFGRSR